MELSADAKSIILRNEIGAGKLFYSTFQRQCFKLDDLVGFIVGGTSSRFWMLRKHFNSFEFVAQEGVDGDITNKG